MTAAQADLFSPPPLRPSLGAVLYGLAGVRGLGEQALGTLFELCDGHLETLWEVPPEAVVTALKAAHIPQAEALTTRLWHEREVLLEQGLAEHTRRRAMGITVLARHELPQGLKTLASPPRWLFVHGDVSVLFRTPAVAVVGTRRASESGIRATRLIVRQLAAYPITVVSGLADGIDHEAHRSSLEARLPNVAFLGHGLDLVFPQETSEVRRQIVDSGGVVASEYLPSTAYSKSTFVQRNRLQVGLADAVIAVEADAKSGTAHTVRFAFEARKPVVGIRSSAAVPDIASVIQEGGGTLVSLNKSGLAELDRLIQRWCHSAGKSSNPIETIIRAFVHEYERRTLTPSQQRELYSKIVVELALRTPSHAENSPLPSHRAPGKRS